MPASVSSSELSVHHMCEALAGSSGCDRVNPEVTDAPRLDGFPRPKLMAEPFDAVHRDGFPCLEVSTVPLIAARLDGVLES